MPPPFDQKHGVGPVYSNSGPFNPSIHAVGRGVALGLR
jgi:hypothetical protein